jgi:hypothetical protein
MLLRLIKKAEANAKPNTIYIPCQPANPKLLWVPSHAILTKKHKKRNNNNKKKPKDYLSQIALK